MTRLSITLTNGNCWVDQMGNQAIMNCNERALQIGISTI